MVPLPRQIEEVVQERPTDLLSVAVIAASRLLNIHGLSKCEMNC